MYCGAHKISAQCNNPTHERPLFSQALLERWKIYCAELFPKLVSSKEVLAQVKIVHSLLDLVQVHVHGPVRPSEPRLCQCWVWRVAV